MQFQYLSMAAVLLLSVGCTQQVTTNPIDSQSLSAKTLSTPVVNTPVVSTPVVKTGTFKPGEHPIQGKVSIVREGGKHYLEFDQNFKTQQGPDVFVILYRFDKPPIGGLKNKDYSTIAPLQKISGSQRYALPKNIKLADFNSVVIWCRKFNATFAYAPLPG